MPAPRERAGGARGPGPRPGPARFLAVDALAVREDRGVTARRRGAEWYVGGISAGPARELTVPLGFLGQTPHDAELWRDVEGDDPNALAHATRPVTSRSTFDVHVARDGGFVARFRPRPREVKAR